MTNVTPTAQTMISDYSGLGAWIGLFTGAPGSTNAPANEASGGSPAYARQETSWTVSGATAIGSGVTINVPAGTYTYMGLFSAATGNTMVDWCAISPQVASGQTTITITPLATAS
jgi:hypothetical protein